MFYILKKRKIYKVYYKILGLKSNNKKFTNVLYFFNILTKDYRFKTKKN